MVVVKGRLRSEQFPCDKCSKKNCSNVERGRTCLGLLILWAGTLLQSYTGRVYALHSAGHRKWKTTHVGLRDLQHVGLHAMKDLFGQQTIPRVVRDER